MENLVSLLPLFAAISLFVAGLDLGIIIGQNSQTNKFFSWIGFICLSLTGIFILLVYYLFVQNP